MQAAASGQLPNAFDGIEFGAVGRQVIESEMVGPLLAPRLMKQGVMILGVVGDDDYSAASSQAGAAKAFEERKESHPIELACLAAEVESSVPQSHSAKVSDTAPCGSVQQ